MSEPETKTTILVGDSMEKLRDLPAESVHCVITSPPYWGLRSYGGDTGMIGLEPTFEEHLERLVAVFREVHRVLRKDGTLWLNYGDCHIGGGRGRGTKRETLEGSKQGTSRHTMAQLGNSERMSMRGIAAIAMDGGLKPKDLMMMPSRVAMALQRDGSADLKAVRVLENAIARLVSEYGEPDLIPDKVRNVLESIEREHAEAKGVSWWLRSEIVWSKPNPMPESARDRPSSAHEKLFLFAKSRFYYYDQIAVRTQPAPATLQRLGQKNFDNQTGGPKDSRTGPRSSRNTLEHHGGFEKHWDNLSKEEQQAFGANLRNVWPIATQPYRGAHFATFPTALVEPCILAGTSERGVCEYCGKPWKRKVEKNLVPTPKASKTNVVDNRDADADRNDAGSNRQKDGHVRGHRNEYLTMGWEKDCEHDTTKPEPAVVLDPFGGAGTVGLVANAHGRASILIEINPEYAEQAKERLTGGAPLLADALVEVAD